jgi:hypothetical protein
MTTRTEIDEARKTIHRQWDDIPDQRAQGLLQLLDRALDVLEAVHLADEQSIRNMQRVIDKLLKAARDVLATGSIADLRRVVDEVSKP